MRNLVGVSLLAMAVGQPISINIDCDIAIASRLAPTGDLGCWWNRRQKKPDLAKRSIGQEHSGAI